MPIHYTIFKAKSTQTHESGSIKGPLLAIRMTRKKVVSDICILFNTLESLVSQFNICLGVLKLIPMCSRSVLYFLRYLEM